MRILTEKLGEDRLDSFWYHNEGLIAEFETDKGSIELSASGEIEVYLPIEKNSDIEDLFKGDNAVEQALRLDFTDTDLKHLYENDKFGLNNWLSIENSECYDNPELTLEIVCSTYDEGIQKLEELFYTEFPDRD